MKVNEMPKTIGGERRTVYLINPVFQKRMIFSLLGLLVIVSIIFISSGFYFFHQMKLSGLNAGLPPEHIYFQFVQNQSYRYLMGSSIAFLLMAFAVIVWGLRMSHKIAGPLYNLCNSIDGMIAEKKFVDLKFRDGDFFPEVADKVNELMKAKG